MAFAKVKGQAAPPPIVTIATGSPRHDFFLPWIYFSQFFTTSPKNTVFLRISTQLFPKSHQFRHEVVPLPPILVPDLLPSSRRWPLRLGPTVLWLLGKRQTPQPPSRLHRLPRLSGSRQKIRTQGKRGHQNPNLHRQDTRVSPYSTLIDNLQYPGIYPGSSLIFLLPPGDGRTSSPSWPKPGITSVPEISTPITIHTISAPTFQSLIDVSVLSFLLHLFCAYLSLLQDLVHPPPPLEKVTPHPTPNSGSENPPHGTGLTVSTRTAKIKQPGKF